MAIYDRQRLLILAFLALLHSGKVSGLVCHACAHNTATGLEADCGSGRPLPCNSDADLKASGQVLLESHLKSTLHTRQARQVVAGGYACFTFVAVRQGATVTTRGCLTAKARNCTGLDYNCTFCNADLPYGKACNGGRNPRTDTEAEFDCHICSHSSASGRTDTCGQETPRPCNLGGVLATNAGFRQLQMESKTKAELEVEVGADAEVKFMCVKAVQEKNGFTNTLRGCVMSRTRIERLCSKNCFECNFCAYQSKDKTKACNAGEVPRTDVAQRRECKSMKAANTLGKAQSSAAHWNRVHVRGLNAVLIRAVAVSALGLVWNLSLT